MKKKNKIFGLKYLLTNLNWVEEGNCSAVLEQVCDAVGDAGAGCFVAVGAVGRDDQGLVLNYDLLLSRHHDHVVCRHHWVVLQFVPLALQANRLN